MTCPDGRTQTSCVAAGALSGAVAGLTFAVAGPLGPTAAGMLSGFTGDATDQLLTTGSYDPVRGAIAAATGGALGWFGGRFTRTPSSKLRTDERPALKAPTACIPDNSFVAGTLVLMADGTRKPIEQIRAGDKVLASDPDADRTEPQTVETTIVGQGTKNLVDITVDTDGAAGSKTGTLVATDRHPFWIQSQHRWIDARDLRPGDLLRTAAGTFVQVTAIHTRTETSHVYNLTVSTVHTYYVIAGNTPVLVHNTGCGPTVPWVTGKLPAAEESALNNTLSHIDAGTVPTGLTAVKWGTKFENRDGDLPAAQGPNSPYFEYRVAPPPGTGGAGPLRVVRNSQSGETYYTWTHYGDSGDPAFVRIR